MIGISHPLVAVSSDVHSFENCLWHATPERYLIAALESAKVTPLIIPSLGGALDFNTILSFVDGILITGSKSNVHPSLYNAEPTQSHEPFDPVRDATSLPIINRAIEYGIPLLAICRGIQELNVALGGTLVSEIQELAGRMDHRAPQSDNQEERFRIRHLVKINPDSCLATILEAESIEVNSLHRQAIDKLAPRLAIEAIAEDGTIEAVTVKDAKSFSLGIQWHPEYWVKTDSMSHKLFAAFGDAVRTHSAIVGRKMT